MRLIKLLTNLLLAVLLALSASTTVSAKVASGSQNLVWTGHQAENVFNWLTCQGKSDRSTTGPPECSVVTNSTAQVVAKEGTTRVGRWMSPTEFNKMSDSGKVIEGAGGRTYVVNPANPDAFKPPKGSTIYSEFDVPSEVLKPASKKEWAVIPEIIRFVWKTSNNSKFDAGGHDGKS